MILQKIIYRLSVAIRVMCLFFLPIGIFSSSKPSHLSDYAYTEGNVSYYNHEDVYLGIFKYGFIIFASIILLFIIGILIAVICKGCYSNSSFSSLYVSFIILGFIIGVPVSNYLKSLPFNDFIGFTLFIYILGLIVNLIIVNRIIKKDLKRQMEEDLHRR